MEAKVIVAKCRCGKYYGIRIEKKQEDWIRTWGAFLYAESADV